MAAMDCYFRLKSARVEQLRRHLVAMGQRRARLSDHCFTVLSESGRSGRSSPSLEVRQSRLAAAASGNTWTRRPATAWDSGRIEEPSPPRFVQFAFRRDCFFVDLPNTILFANEAAALQRHRRGFYFARQRGDLEWGGGDPTTALRFNPLQKTYIYRDEESAAEDVAFLLFGVWRFPVETPLYVFSATFGGGCFEWGGALASAAVADVR